MSKHREFGDALKKCDSWSEVEYHSADTTLGCYGVTIFFKTHEEADDFRENLAEEIEKAC